MRSDDTLPEDKRQLYHSIISHNSSYLKCLLIHSLLLIESGIFSASDFQLGKVH